MLLFNIGELSDHLPPHFMMLQEIDQTRTFSGAGSFSWTYLTDSLRHLFGTTPATSLTANGADTYLAGFTGTAIESPTIKFLPLQGPDFFQRLESPQTDKFTYFLEEQRRYGTWDEREWLTLLFAESLHLESGSLNGPCREGYYLNGDAPPALPPAPPAQSPQFKYYYEDFQNCVHELTHRDDLDFENIDGFHKIADFGWKPGNTTPVDEPKAADVLAAIQAGYQWRSVDRSVDKTSCTTSDAATPCYTFNNAIKIPGWFSPSIYEKLTEVQKNDIAEIFWPTPSDYFYIDVAENPPPSMTMLMPSLNSMSLGTRIKGSFKIANLLEIMRRLGEMACDDDHPNDDNCVFGTSKKNPLILPVPRWADSSTTFVARNSHYGARDIESVWVPAHDPDGNKHQKDLAKRDRYVFFMLSKLYQTSLVDTSKLVTGSTPITISK